MPIKMFSVLFLFAVSLVSIQAQGEPRVAFDAYASPWLEEAGFLIVKPDRESGASRSSGWASLLVNNQCASELGEVEKFLIWELGSGKIRTTREDLVFKDIIKVKSNKFKEYSVYVPYIKEGIGLHVKFKNPEDGCMYRLEW